MAVIDTDTAEGKAELQKLIDAAEAGLKAKNDELLKEVKQSKETLKSLQEQVTEIKTAKQLAEEEAARKSGDVNKIQEALEAKFARERETLAAERDTVKSNLHKLLVDNGLTDALSKSGVAPHFLDAAKALIKTQSKIEIAELDGSATALIGGKTVTDFVSDWARGDHGKHYIAAPANGGGGASGSNGSGGAATAKQMSRSEFDALPAAQRMEVSKSGVQLTTE